MQVSGNYSPVTGGCEGGGPGGVAGFAFPSVS